MRDRSELTAVAAVKTHKSTPVHGTISSVVAAALVDRLVQDRTPRPVDFHYHSGSLFSPPCERRSAQVSEFDPISFVRRNAALFMRPEDREHWLEGYRKSGLFK